jgi:hypothetical protein
MPDDDEDDDQIYSDEANDAVDLGEPAREIDESDDPEDPDAELQGEEDMEKQLNQAQAAADAGEDPVPEEDDEPAPAPEPAPIRPRAVMQATQSTRSGPVGGGNNSPVTQPPPQTQSAPTGQVTMQRPVKDDSGKIVGYEVLDTAGNTIDEYAVDASGNRLQEKPWWLHEEGVTMTVVPPTDEGNGWKVLGGFIGGFLGGMLVKKLWDDYQDGD